MNVPEALTPQNLVRSTLRFIVEVLILLMESLRDFFTRGGTVRAAALTFTTLLSLIPLLGLVAVIFRQVGGFEWLSGQLNPLLQNYLSPAGSESITTFLMDRASEMSLAKLGVVGITFLLFGTWSLISTVETDLNGIWGVQRSRSFLQRIARTWLLMTLLPVMAGLSVYFSGQALLVNLLDALPAWLNEAGGHVLPMILQGFAFFLLYWSLPNTRVRILPAVFGAAFTAFSWELAKWGFTAWTLRVGSYNLVYGSFAFLPLFMLWLLLSWILILIGAEFSFVIQNRRALLTGRAWHREGPLPDYLLALVLLRLVADDFGHGTLSTPGELARRLDLPEAELNRVAESLIQNDLLRIDAEDGLLPARPFDHLLPEEVARTFLKSPQDYLALRRSHDLVSVLTELDVHHSKMLQSLNAFPFQLKADESTGSTEISEEKNES
jgi:membrane protein